MPEQVFIAQPIGIGKAQIIATPFQFEFTGEDRLVMAVYSSVSTIVVATLRFVDRDGTIDVSQHILNVIGDRTQQTSRIAMGHGFLSNLVVRPVSAGVQAGQCYVVVFVIRGGGTGPTTTIGQVLGGYTTLNAPLAWPGSPIIASTEGAGAYLQLDFPSPSLGQPFVTTVPINTRWGLLTAAAHIITDGTAGNREVFLVGVSATPRNMFVIGLPQAVAANADISITWGRGFTMTQSVGPLLNSRTAPLPIETVMPAGALIQIGAVNMAAGDQVFLPSLSVQEWLAI